MKAQLPGRMCLKFRRGSQQVGQYVTAMTDMALTRSELSNKIFWGIPVKRTGRPKSACWSKSFRGPVLILTALKPLFPGLLCSGPTFPHCFRNAFAAGGRHPTYGALSEKSSKTFSCPASPSAKRVASWKSLYELSRRVDARWFCRRQPPGTREIVRCRFLTRAAEENT